MGETAPPRGAEDEQVRLLAPKDLPGLELWFVHHSFRPVERLFLETYALAVGLVGQARISYRGAHTRVRGPLFQVHQAGEVLSSHPLEGRYTFVSLLIQPELMATLAEPVAGAAHTPYFPALIPEHAPLNRQLARLAVTLAARVEGAATPLERQGALAELVRLLVTTSAEKGLSERPQHPERGAVRAAKAYLLEHVHEDVGFLELAEVAQLSPYHLIRVFKGEVGVTPASFQLQARVQRAKALLLRGERVAQVALALGFADQAHFTRVFKRYLGVTPGRFVKENR